VLEDMTAGKPSEAETILKPVEQGRQSYAEELRFTARVKPSVESTPDGLLRHVVYLGQREDKQATEVRRSPLFPAHVRGG
jgi:hypothetical protein